MNKISYVPDEEAVVYLHFSKVVKDTTVCLYTVSGEKADEVKCDLKPQYIIGSKPSRDGYNFDATFEYKIPNLKSGIYLWNHIVPFIVRNPSKNSQIVILYPSNTENAYNSDGGEDFYLTDSTTKASYPILSFLRPHIMPPFISSFVYWFEHQSYDVSYIADCDLDDYSEIENAKLIIIPGHSEYWSRKARVNFDRFIDQGKNAAIFSGNTMWWQVRYNEDKTQLICYKNANLDPILDVLLKTDNWTMDPFLQYPTMNSIGADYMHGGYGIRYKDNGWDGYKIVLPNSPLLNGTNLQKGDIISCPTHEYDGAPISGFDLNGIPVIDNSKLNFFKIELIGFDHASRNGKTETVPTFIVFQKTLASGIIVNTASTNWCSSNAFNGRDGIKIKTITANIINMLQNGENVFSQ